MAKKMTVSVVKGRGSMNHNNREFITQNVDRERTRDNITYKKESLEDAYDKLFSAELERYNKGKKPCRQINNYMEHIRNSKNGEKLFYETVVQVGDKFSCGIGSDNAETAKEILNKYMANWGIRNPNLYVFNAVLHLDEATPHLHIDYIPVAKGYQKGLQVRNSLDRALKQQGIDGKANKQENSTHNWQESEKQYLAEIMLQHGWERAPERGVHREHMSVNQYKAVAEQTINEAKSLPKQIESKPLLMDKSRVSVDAGDLKRLEKRAKVSIVHEKAITKAEAEITTLHQQTVKYVEKKRSEADELKQEGMQYEARYQMLVDQFGDYQVKYHNLEAEHDRVLHNYEVQVNKNKALQAEISDLRGSVEQRVEKAVEPYKSRIEALENRLKGFAKVFVDIIKCFNMLAIGKRYGIRQITENQKELINVVREYGREQLKENLEGVLPAGGIQGFVDESKKNESFAPGELLNRLPDSHRTDKYSKMEFDQFVEKLQLRDQKHESRSNDEHEL